MGLNLNIMRTHRLWKPMVTLLIKNKQTWMTDWISCGIITPWKSWKRALSCTMELCSHFQDWNRAMQWHPTPVLLPGKSHGQRSLEGCSPWGRWGSDTTELPHFHFHALEKEMATHSSVLAWRIPGRAEPDGLLSMGSHRVGHDGSDLAAAYIQ